MRATAPTCSPGKPRRVLALDYDAPTAAHVARAYPSVRAVRGNLAALPVRSSTVDVVVNLQVIEHLWDQRGFLAECLRVLRPGGRLLITTPNRITFSPGRDTPLNPFHTRELAAAELDELLRRCGFARSSCLPGFGTEPGYASWTPARRLDHRRPDPPRRRQHRLVRPICWPRSRR